MEKDGKRGKQENLAHKPKGKLASAAATLFEGTACSTNQHVIKLVNSPSL